MKNKVRAGQREISSGRRNRDSAVPGARREAFLPGNVIRAFIAAEDERDLELVRMLHDSVGQQVATLLLGLRQLEQARPEDAKLTCQSLHAIAQALGHELHMIALQMRPTALEDHGFTRTLATYLEEWSLVKKIPVELDVVSLGSERLSRPVEIGLFLIVCAALREVSRHPNGTYISIILKRHPGSILAVIEDNAKWDTAGDTPAPSGDVAIMAGRTALLGGTLTFERREGGGMTTFVRLPAGPAISS